MTARTQVISFFAILASLLSTAPAWADASTMSQQRTQLKEACTSDVSTLCKDVTPGEGRVGACLDSKEDQLSTGCRTAWSNAKTKLSQKMDKGELAFRKSCGSDVQKFCSEVPSGRGRLLDCLSEHHDDLSNSCKSLQSKIDQKLSEYLG